MVVYYHWTGLVDWTGGLDYWTPLFRASGFSGMEWWTGTLEWNDGMMGWNIK